LQLEIAEILFGLICCIKTIYSNQIIKVEDNAEVYFHLGRRWRLLFQTASLS